ncbi:hypothetical protein [Dysgonomonas capnocytophagoides]|uniref:hypothetical protein n=1 Tax=Dysgonomonas capnocytophagoides TaxID=45254 RepID=UPI00291D7442|nr:hypothetical protein DCPSUM001_12010 [Dysgonomonas capnocytophagoides]
MSKQAESDNLVGLHGSYEKDMDEAFERAAQIDNIVLFYLKDAASQKKYMPQVFRSCRGILRKRPSAWTSYFKN